MENKPLVSIIMPVFNSEKYLKESIESVLNQSYENWELLCVNDGSTDHSLHILNQFALQDKRILVFDQKNSGTAAGARNTALKHVRGEYIQMLDSDDLLSYDSLEKALEKAITCNSDYVILDMLLFELSISNVISKIEGYFGNREVILDSSQAFKESLTWNIGGIGLIKTELLKRFGFDSTGMNGDEYTTRLLLLNSKNITFCDGDYYYRQHIESTTKKLSIKRFDIIRTNFRLLELAKTTQLSNKILKICKKNIVSNFSGLVLYYIINRDAFTFEEQTHVQNLIFESFERIKFEKITSDIYTNFKMYLMLFFLRNGFISNLGLPILLGLRTLKKKFAY